MDEQPPDQEATDDGVNVFWEPVRYSPEEIQAELPDGTRVQAVLLLGGRRLGFDRPLPLGTYLLLRGRVAWGPIKSTR